MCRQHSEALPNVTALDCVRRRRWSPQQHLCVQDTRHQLEKCQSTLRSKQDELCRVRAGFWAQQRAVLSYNKLLPVGSLVRHRIAPVICILSSKYCSLQCCEAAASSRILLQADAGISEAVKAAKAKWEAQRQEDQQELQVKLCPGRSAAGVAFKQCALLFAVGTAECAVS